MDKRRYINSKTLIATVEECDLCKGNPPRPEYTCRRCGDQGVVFGVPISIVELKELLNEVNLIEKPKK